MKKLKIFFLAAVAILSLQSCDMLSSSGKFDLAQPEKVKVLKEKIDKNIKTDKDGKLTLLEE